MAFVYVYQLQIVFKVLGHLALNSLCLALSKEEDLAVKYMQQASS